MKRRTKMMAAGGAVAAALLVVWSARLRIAHDLVDRRLTAAHVPASYRITRIGPFLERLENVRIGNPAAPDLVARRIDVLLGYGLTGPYVRAIEVDGARLRAGLGADGLTLGSIDRLMPVSHTGGAVLPDLGVTLRDTQVALTTPNGRVHAAIEGSGNPARLFEGTVKASGDTLRIATCRVVAASADLQLTVRSGAPEVRGPVRVGQVGCPDLAVSRGTATLELLSDPTFRKVAARAKLEGFGGTVGPARFAGLSATARANGVLGRLDLDGDLTLHALSVPEAVRTASADIAALAGTPLGPTTTQARAALVRVLGRSDATATLGVAIRARRSKCGCIVSR